MVDNLFSWIFRKNNPEDYSNVEKRRQDVLREYQQEKYEAYQKEEEQSRETKAVERETKRIQQLNASFNFQSWWVENGGPFNEDHMYNSLYALLESGLSWGILKDGFDRWERSQREALGKQLNKKISYEDVKNSSVHKIYAVMERLEMYRP